MNAPLILKEEVTGTVHVAIGDYKSFGGENDSMLHLDLISIGLTMRVDGKPVLISGQLQVCSRLGMHAPKQIRKQN